VTEPIHAHETGRIRIGGEIWSAAPYDETSTIETGQTVEVLQIRGATAVVYPIPSLEG
jgi:membrane protein implicated in regulation of membrane protease activity